MYLETCTIKHIKCFDEITLDFRNPDGSVRLWNVIIGENGTGKTTLLKAIAIALLGEKAASVLLPRPRGWVRARQEAGEIDAIIRLGREDTEAGDISMIFNRRLGKPIDVSYRILEGTNDPFGNSGPTITEKSDYDEDRLFEGRSDESLGWLAAGYGSFRRMTANHKRASDISEYQNREARFVTLFRESEDLMSCVDWLLDIDNISRDEQNSQHSSAKKIRDLVIDTLNSHILPEEVRLSSLSSKGVFFRTPYADEISIFDLSDGYRAIISMIFDILRQTSQTHGAFLLHYPDWRERLEGVILIDELDVHLHPRWQRQIGASLRTCFPKLQFIITTHSPFIPQVADDHGLFVLREDPATRTVRVEQDDVSVRGWGADQILAILFETPSIYAPDAAEKLHRLAQLEALARRNRLSPTKQMEYDQLKAWSTEHIAPPGNSREEMEESREQDQYIDNVIEQKGKETNNDQN